VTQVGSAELERAAEAGLARSRSARVVLLAVGHGCVALGVIGAFLPIMPTTVFLIVAASCYARASSRLYNRLLAHRVFGPMIRDWQLHRAMTVRSKVIALGAIVAAFGVTLGFALKEPWVRMLHLATGLVLVGIILAIRTRRA
jgi:uncharacterized membrane protein YbaN (DUF454 family)